MELLNIFYSTLQSSAHPVDEVFEPELSPWKQADMAMEVRILVWKVAFNLLFACSYIFKTVNICVSTFQI